MTAAAGRRRGKNFRESKALRGRLEPLRILATISADSGVVTTVSLPKRYHLKVRILGYSVVKNLCSERKTLCSTIQDLCRECNL